MKEYISGISQYLLYFWDTWIATSEGVATLLLGFIICLKLYTNRKAEAIDYKHMILSIPGEILFLDSYRFSIKTWRNNKDSHWN